MLPDDNDTITKRCMVNCNYKNTDFSFESEKDVGDFDFLINIFFQMRILSQRRKWIFRYKKKDYLISEIRKCLIIRKY